MRNICGTIPLWKTHVVIRLQNFVGVKFRKEKSGYKESILIPAQNAFDIVPIGESPAICGWLSFFLRRTSTTCFCCHERGHVRAFMPQTFPSMGRRAKSLTARPDARGKHLCVYNTVAVKLQHSYKHAENMYAAFVSRR